MSAHELADQPLAGGVAQLVVVLDLDLQDPVGFDLAHGGDAPAGDVLAHQHAQGGRFQRAGFLLTGQVGAGASCACGEQQKMVFVM